STSASPRRPRSWCRRRPGWRSSRRRRASVMPPIYSSTSSAMVGGTTRSTMALGSSPPSTAHPGPTCRCSRCRDQFAWYRRATIASRRGTTGITSTITGTTTMAGERITTITDTMATGMGTATGTTTRPRRTRTIKIVGAWNPRADVVLHEGDTLGLLRALPDACVQLVITSPPYNLGKAYERARASLDAYVAGQAAVIAECARVLCPGGSLSWQVGDHVTAHEVLPLDLVLFGLFRAHQSLRLRNRIVWHFEHGLHCTRRFSGRHEVILWFTKGDAYRFDLDPVRVPQKYPGKRAWKGPRIGEYTGNPAGKNPGDVWIFPNVKANHIEKTVHPCQFPVELV